MICDNRQCLDEVEISERISRMQQRFPHSTMSMRCWSFLTCNDFGGKSYKRKFILFLRATSMRYLRFQFGQQTHDPNIIQTGAHGQI